MPAIIPVLVAIALVLAAAKLGGWLASYLGQPPVLGELLMGLVLGPSVLDSFGYPYFATVHTTETLHILGELGVIFLMFAAGLEVQLTDFAKIGRPALTTGVFGVLVPILFGVLVIPFFGYTLAQASFIGIVLAATSVSISAQTLIELGLLRSREGMILLGAAVADDVLAVALLSAFVALATSGSGALLGSLWVVIRMLLFLFGAFWVGRRWLPALVTRVAGLPISEAGMAFAIVSALLFAWSAEALGGVAAITGAFVAGVALAGSTQRGELERGIHTLNYAFFVPLFLVGIGLTANLRLLSGQAIGFALVLCLVAIVAKVLGAGTGAKLGGATWPEAWRVGVGMVSRGEVGLIVAGVGVSNGLLAADVFTVVVLMVLVTTIVTPPLLRWSFRTKAVKHD